MLKDAEDPRSLLTPAKKAKNKIAKTDNQDSAGMLLESSRILDSISPKNLLGKKMLLFPSMESQP